MPYGLILKGKCKNTGMTVERIYWFSGISLQFVQQRELGDPQIRTAVRDKNDLFFFLC